MGKHYILTSGHVPTQVLEVMVCSPWRQCWFMCHLCKRNCPQYSTMQLVLSHHESRYIRYQYSYVIVERGTMPLWPNNDWQTELVSKELSCADYTECIERDLKALLLEAMGFVHNEDNDDLSSTHVTSKTCSVTPGEQRYINIFHVIGERTTISLWHNKCRWAELISSIKYRPHITECLERAFTDLFQGFI